MEAPKIAFHSRPTPKHFCHSLMQNEISRGTFNTRFTSSAAMMTLIEVPEEVLGCVM
jgi:hypothetical protein